MTDESKPSSLFTPSKLVLQFGGFAAGTVLLVWIVKNAIQEGNLDQIRHANPWLVLALLGTTLISTLLNGAGFWITIRPIRDCGFGNLQNLNMFCNMLNYAPVRIGAVARIAYHLRLDRLNLLQISLWFSLVGGVLFVTVGACMLASLIRGQLDIWWLLIVVVQIALGGGAARLIMCHPLIARYTGGFDRVLADDVALWGAFALRFVDIFAYATRMWIAALILDIHLAPHQIVVLAVVALAASVIPIGRVGFREFCVAAVATRLELLASDVEANMNQLALVESAGEALFFIPVGAVLTFWYRKKWRQNVPDALPPEGDQAAA